MSNKNTQQHAADLSRESLSAVLDGQTDEFELRKVLRDLDKDDDVRNTARRYQMIGNTIRKDSNDFMAVDLSAGIRQRLDEEPDESMTSATFSGLKRFVMPMARVSVAASIALVVVVGMRTMNVDRSDPSFTALPALPASPTLEQPLQISSAYNAVGIKAGYNSGERDSLSQEQLAEAQNVANRAIRERFRAYALQHAEIVSMNAGQGVMPFARLTTFETE